jgi:hypothetical protein
MIECLDEEEWIAAAKEGGNMGNLERAFYWVSARDWPCPGIVVKDGQDPDKLHPDKNGWFTFWHNTTGRRYTGGGQIGRDIKIPPHIREYIGMMYVDWKMWEQK